MSKVRFSRRALSTSLVGAALVVAGTTAQAGWLFVLAAGVLGVVAGSLVLLPSLRGAEVERHLPRRVRAGDEAQVVVRVRNRGKRSLPLMRVRDSLQAFEPASMYSDGLAPGATAHVETTRRAARRGVYESGWVHLQTSAPLGFARRVVSRKTPAAVTVVPSWVELGAWSPLHSAGMGGEDSSSRAGHGGDYLGVRDYRPGDPVRSVHWRSAARAGRLIVTEHEEQARRRVLIALAGSDAGRPPDSAFETLVQAAASIAKSSLDATHRVSLLYSGGELYDATFGDCLEALAAAVPDERPLTPRLEQTVARAGGGGGTAVLLATDSEQARKHLGESSSLLGAHGYRTVAVLADLGSWLGPPAPAGPRPPVAGARTMTVRRNDDLRACLQA